MFIRVQVALLAGTVPVAPIRLYQLCVLMTSGLKHNEKSWPTLGGDLNSVVPQATEQITARWG